MIAIFRPELLKEGLAPPYETFIPFKDEKIDWSIAYECLQPDAWDYEEFSTLLLDRHGGLIRVMSIDFEFDD